MFITDNFSGNFGAGGFTILAHAGLDPSRTTKDWDYQHQYSHGSRIGWHNCSKMPVGYRFFSGPVSVGTAGYSNKRVVSAFVRSYYGPAWSSLSVRASDGIRNGLMPFEVHLSRSLGTLAVSGLCSSRGVVSLCPFQAIEHQTECL